MTEVLHLNLPREFALAAACTRWPPSDERSRAIAHAAHEPVDWNKFVRVVRRHRVVGLVHNGLVQASVAVPEPILRTIADTAAQQVHQNLRFAAEAVRLQKAFHDESLPVTFFKGVLTGIDLYGDIGIRHGKDIDLLVSRQSMLRAGRVLERLGYLRVAPPSDLDEARTKTLLWIGKDFVYVRTDDATIEVELHWRLFNNASFMAFLPAAERRYPALNNVVLRTFCEDDQFSYLCAHGAAFAWSRLKWLADIGAILSREDHSGIARLYESAAARGAARPAAQAILLCHRLLGADVPPQLIDRWRANRAIRSLERLAIRAMTQGDAEIEPYDLPNGMLPVAMSLWLLGGTPRYLWGELNSRWISWDDVVDVPLPSGLQFLYPILRVPLWVWRRTRHRPQQPA